jgi:hypothetical protein
MKLMRDSIQEMYNKFKSILSEDLFFYAVLITLASVLSFGLGRWSVAQRMTLNETVIQAPALIYNSTVATSSNQQKTATTSTVSHEVQIASKYVGSRSGTKYHLLWCPGAKTIKETNKVYFGSKEEAEKAGYTPAANCKGI